MRCRFTLFGLVSLALLHFGSTLNEKCSSLEELELPFVQHLTANTDLADNSRSAVFINLLPYAVNRYWDDGTPEGLFQGSESPGRTTSVGSYVGHIFVYKDSNGRELHRFHVEEQSLNMFLVHGNDHRVKQSESYKKRVQQLAFMERYKEKEGTPWLAHYDEDAGPRGPPIHHMWPADSIGQLHHVQTAHGHKDSPLGTQSLQTIPLRVVSVTPRVLYVADLLSVEECDLIISLSKDNLGAATIGEVGSQYADNTRTSKNTWLDRSVHPQLETVFKRFSDVLNLDDSTVMQHSGPKASSELLQVVHYLPGQEYRPHYDFFDTGQNATRMLTLLIYLNGGDDGGNTGGGTSFPKAFEGRGLQVRAPQGSAILFYSLRSDGNTDRLSEHAGLPVPEGQGEKWICNLWVWDPIKS